MESIESGRSSFESIPESPESEEKVLDKIETLTERSEKCSEELQEVKEVRERIEQQMEELMALLKEGKAEEEKLEKEIIEIDKEKAVYEKMKMMRGVKEEKRVALTEAYKSVEALEEKQEDAVERRDKISGDIKNLTGKLSNMKELSNDFPGIDIGNTIPNTENYLVDLEKKRDEADKEQQEAYKEINKEMNKIEKYK